MSGQIPHPLHLSGDLSLRSISELHAQLTGAIGAHDAVAISTAAVESIDVAALQLLVSAGKTAFAGGHTLSLTAPADSPMARALVAAGFFAADGVCKVPSLSSWTITREAA